MSQNREELAEQCAALASQSSILDILESELRTRGFSGPANVPKFVALSLYTRWFRKPVSAVIKGPSGSGKSFALKAGLQFIPDDACESFSGMSEKALVYLNDLDLKHRFLVIGEAAGLASGEGRALLRQLLSEGHVKYATVQKTKDGLAGKLLKPLEGPTGLLMTTTANSLHPEDESRMLSIPMDEDLERVREALIQQAIGHQELVAPIDLTPWHALHCYVGANSLSVGIPYLADLANKLPVSHFRVMRDFPHITSLIRAHALMHQYTRDRVTSGAVLATIEDYRAVYDLIAEPLAQGLDESVSNSVREVVEGVRALTPASDAMNPPWDDTSVSQVKLAEALQRDPSVISRNVKKAVSHGYLKNLNPGQGREAKLVVGDRELPTGTALPSPEELMETKLAKAA